MGKLTWLRDWLRTFHRAFRDYKRSDASETCTSTLLQESGEKKVPHGPASLPHESMLPTVTNQSKGTLLSPHGGVSRTHCGHGRLWSKAKVSGTLPAWE